MTQFVGWPGLIHRIAQTILALLIALDVVTQVILFAPVYLVWGVPLNPRWTISGRAGWLSARGWPYLARLIDDLPVFGEGHCERAFRHERGI